MKIYIAFLFILLASGCASVSYQPIPEGYQGPLAAIKDTSNSLSSRRVQFFELKKINERDVKSSSVFTHENNYGGGMLMYVTTTARQVPAKKSVLNIQGVTHVAAPILALGGEMYSISGEVSVNLEADKIYVVKGELSKEYQAVWLEDSEGNILTEKIEKSLK